MVECRPLPGARPVHQGPVGFTTCRPFFLNRTCLGVPASPRLDPGVQHAGGVARRQVRWGQTQGDAMTFQAPVDDIRFIFKELADLDGILKLPDHTELDVETIDAVLQENARFVEEVVAPLNRKGDLEPARWQDGEVRTSPGFKEAFGEFARGGWQGLLHDEKWGGQGLPKLLSAAATEILNAGNLSFALCPLLTDGVIEALSSAGTPEQCERFIPPLVEGRWTGTMNLTEPQAGSDLALLSTRAIPQDDGTYRLHGQKIFITFGEHDMAENIIHLVLARTPDAPKGVKGISLFLV